MDKILIGIGLFSIAIVVIYLIRKINDYLNLKEERKHSYKIDRDDD
jgi:hypothetical protein